MTHFEKMLKENSKPEGGLMSSPNLCSFYSQFLSQSSWDAVITRSPDTLNNDISDSFHSRLSKQSLTASQQALITDIQHNFVRTQAKDKHFQSLSPNSSFNSNCSSLSLSPPSIKNDPWLCDSSFSVIKSDEVVLDSLDLELSMLEWDNKRKNIKNKVLLNNSKTAYLISENEEMDSRMMFQSKEALITARALDTLTSVDSSPEEEGSIRTSIASRLFLNGNTASKHRLLQMNSERIQHIPPKILEESQSVYLDTSRTFPYGFSPLLRKIAIFQETRRVLSETPLNTFECSISTGGFLTSPHIKYSSPPAPSEAFIPDDKCLLLLSLSPIVTKNLSRLSITYISCGYEHIAGLSSIGKIYTWGKGISGCLGNGESSNKCKPEIIESISMITFLTVECGAYHTLALTQDKEVYVWGRNDVNQCGVEKAESTKDAVGFVLLKPRKLNVASKFTSFACGEAHSILLTDDGNLLSCGWDEEGQLGAISKSLIKKIQIDEKVVKIKCGSIFSAAVSEAGKVYVWGNGEHGELGLGKSILKQGTPRVVASISQEFIVDLVCGESHVLAMSFSKVYGWGKGIVNSIMGEDYAPGSEIICFAPVFVGDVNSVQKAVVSSRL